MNILDQIIRQKHQEVAERKSLIPAKLLEQSIYFEGKAVSMCKYIRRQDKTGIISEFKRKSPSKGIINATAAVEPTTIGYMQAGASALSILTDSEFFGGKNEDLTLARKYNFCPILRKDFIIDEYQIIEAKSIGADCILLIAAVLNPAEISSLAAFAHALGMEVLLEVHDQNELDMSLNEHLDLIGVNNRNLKTFDVSIETSLSLIESIPDQFVKISESGISEPETLVKLKKAGFDGFLIGENFMRSARPNQAANNFMNAYRELLASDLGIKIEK
jgi:indole-3-glycerol phosphate synthase